MANAKRLKKELKAESDKRDQDAPCPDCGRVGIQEVIFHVPPYSGPDPGVCPLCIQRARDAGITPAVITGPMPGHPPQGGAD